VSTCLQQTGDTGAHALDTSNTEQEPVCFYIVNWAIAIEGSK